jgi:hypothetical protein
MGVWNVGELARKQHRLSGAVSLARRGGRAEYGEFWGENQDEKAEKAERAETLKG